MYMLILVHLQFKNNKKRLRKKIGNEKLTTAL